MLKYLLILLILTSSLFAKADKISPIPPAKEIYPNLALNYCDQNCLFEELQSGLYFNFLASYNLANSNELLANIYAKLSNNLTDFPKDFKQNTSIKVALMIPQNTIKIYSNILINSTIAYLLRKQSNIKLKVFLIGSQSPENIAKSLAQIKQEGYTFLIAGLTDEGVTYLAKDLGDLDAFIPTVNKNDSEITQPNLYFGGIDYKAQITKLLDFANNKIKVFSNTSPVARRIDKDVKQLVPSATFINIASSSFDFKRLLKGNKSFDNSSIFFNTSLIKTALASSQIRSYELVPRVLLSTQINYNPILLHLTQPGDLKYFLFANSIFCTDATLSYLNDIFSQNISYNWVAYSTSIGLDLFYSKLAHKSSQRIFSEELKDNQVVYQTKIMHSRGLGFEEYDGEF